MSRVVTFGEIMLRLATPGFSRFQQAMPGSVADKALFQAALAADGDMVVSKPRRGLVIDRPNQVWAMDITYIPMARGFVYLAAVVDWFSRRVLAWRLSNSAAVLGMVGFASQIPILVLGPFAGVLTDPAEQRARQGAMSFGAEADDLAGAALLRGPIAPLGLWLMFACFSAGTPSTSKYARWIERLIAEGRAGGRPEQVLQCLPGPGEPPFVAAIPKAALKNPRGPLAFIGHVDLAWTWSFQERDTGQALARPAKFINIMWSLLKGDRAGVSFRELMIYFGSTNTELTSLYDRDQAAQQAGEAPTSGC